MAKRRTKKEIQLDHFKSQLSEFKSSAKVKPEGYLCLELDLIELANIDGPEFYQSFLELI